jgi:Kef-type K+ transport system membrane component KefB
MVAGFVVQNFSKQGEHFLRSIHQMGGIVYVVFFATAGAHLDLPLLQRLWPAAVTLAVTRAIMTWVAARLANRLAEDPPELRRWGYSGLISQAGLALGLAALVSRKFPTFGGSFGALAIATIALNEMFGPILFKFALDRSGESSTAPAATRTSLLPPPS